MEQLNKSFFYNIICLIALIMIFFTAIIVGKYTITIHDILGIILGKENLDIEKSVIIYQRIPRTIIAMLTGGALAVSGLIYQEIFNNELVSPDILGVSNGAGFGACIAILMGVTNSLIVLFSFFSGILTMIGTMHISKLFKTRQSTTLLLAGIIMGGFMASGISFVKYMAGSDAQLGEITFWLLGSFSSSTYDDILVFLPIFLTGIIVLFLLRWRINIIALGKNEAQTKGINYNVYLTIIIVIVTILTGASVAFCGVIGWCGLVIPHISRLLGGSDIRKSLSLTILFGSIFMIVSDIISRSFTYAEIPISAVTGFLGTPIFLVVLLILKRCTYDIT